MRPLFLYFLFVYHLIFSYLGYRYILENDGDAYKYWYLTNDWSTYLNIGPDIIKLINYPFSKILDLPFWFGFILYSLIGYFAILELYRFAGKYLKPENAFLKFLMLMLFLMPTLHFWTSIIGKEPVIFLSITWVLIQQTEEKYFSLKSVLGWLLLVIIRPHVAMFLLLAIMINYILEDKKSAKRKLAVASFGALFCLVLYMMTMHILHRNPFDLPLILEKNQSSLLAFRRAGSYVPMINYNIFERFFALNFRPLFFDSDSFFTFVLSAENLLILILFVFSLFVFFRNYKNIKLVRFERLVFLFFVISSLFFIQRYACLGIFVRTKMMYLPFVLIALLKILSFDKLLRSK